MSKSLIIAKKEAKSLLNEKTLLLAIIIQLLIASFSSLLVFGLASFFDPTALEGYNMDSAKVGIVGNGEIKQFIEKSQISPKYYSDLRLALNDFDNLKIDAILVIPDISPESNEIIELLIYLPKSDLRGTLVTLQLKKPLEEFENFVRKMRNSRTGFEPIKLYVDKPPKKISTYFEFIYGVLIPLLVFTPIFISGGLIIDTITEEYEQKTLALLLVSPLSFSEILNGKMLTAIVIVPFQALLWLLLLEMNGIAVYNVWIILLIAIIISANVVMIGSIVAVKYKERGISQYMFSLILILMFMVGAFVSDSPFALITRLASGSIVGSEVFILCSVYLAMAIPFYIFIKKLTI